MGLGLVPNVPKPLGKKVEKTDVGSFIFRELAKCIHNQWWHATLAAVQFNDLSHQSNSNSNVQRRSTMSVVRDVGGSTLHVQKQELS
jgi:hypothetical protein